MMIIKIQIAILTLWGVCDIIYGVERSNHNRESEDFKHEYKFSNA